MGRFRPYLDFAGGLLLTPVRPTADNLEGAAAGRNTLRFPVGGLLAAVRRRGVHARMTGRLAAIAMKSKPRQPMQELQQANISLEAGIEGDIRGASPGRQITIVFAQDWRAAVADLAPDAPWTLRRANLLLEGIENPEAGGGKLAIGPVVLEITGETTPCSMMEKQLAGLREALKPDWRGGLTANVLLAGRIAVGDPVSWVVSRRAAE